MPRTDSDDVEVANIIIVPPDGKYGWVVVAAAFYCIFMMEGMNYTFSLLFDALQEEFRSPKSQISLINSLTMGFSFFSGPIAGTLSNRFGFRPVIMTGGVISSIGIAISVFMNSIVLLYFTYGVIGGIGFGMIYTNVILCVGFYFEKWRGLATGMATSGTGVGMICFSHFIHNFLKNHSYRNLLAIFSGCIFSLVIVGLCFRPIEPIKIGSEDEEESFALVPLNLKTTKSRRNTEYPTATDKMNIDPRRSSLLSAITHRRMTEIELKELFKPLAMMPYQSEIHIVIKRPNEDKTFKGRLVRCFQICRTKNCKNCCASKGRRSVTGFRPFYRDDIFFEGSINRLAEYTDSQGPQLPEVPQTGVRYSVMTRRSIYYHMSVSRLPTYADLWEEKEEKCICCPERVKRIFKTLFDYNIFKIPSFVLYLVSSCFLTMVVSVPLVYLAAKATYLKILEKDEIPWLISSFGIVNAIGRIICGILTNFKCVRATVLHIIALLFGATLNVGITFFESKGTTFAYAALYGLVLAEQGSMRSIILVELVGLENLSNAFGMFLLFLGIFTICGAPTSGVVKELSGSFEALFYYASAMLFAATLCLLPTVIFRKRLEKYLQQKKQ